MYGKLINNELHPIRLPIKTDEEDIFTNDEEVLCFHGWKKVVFTPSPEVDENHTFVEKWTEKGNRIVQEWDIIELEHTDELSSDEVLAELEAIL